jgi:hypothetical protein
MQWNSSSSRQLKTYDFYSGFQTFNLIRIYLLRRTHLHVAFHFQSACVIVIVAFSDNSDNQLDAEARL